MADNNPSEVWREEARLEAEAKARHAAPASCPPEGPKIRVEGFSASRRWPMRVILSRRGERCGLGT